MNDRPLLHALVYADFGAGKSTFAATWPRPIWVAMFDAYGKEMPYLKLARSLGGRVDEGSDDRTRTPYAQVLDAAGNLVVCVEYYVDADLQQPEAYARFAARKQSLRDEVDAGLWQTVVLDSVTFAELAARKYHQYVLNAASRDPRQWYGGSSDLIEEALLGQFAGLRTNVVIVAHVDRQKEDVNGVSVNMPSMPGQRLFKSVPAAYAEIYHAYVGKGQDGKPVYLLQTRSDAMYPASSQIDAPDPCRPAYDAVWVHWEAARGEPTDAEVRKERHA